jgi:hypothetical protein
VKIIPFILGVILVRPINSMENIFGFYQRFFCFSLYYISFFISVSLIEYKIYKKNFHLEKKARKYVVNSSLIFSSITFIFTASVCSKVFASLEHATHFLFLSVLLISWSKTSHRFNYLKTSLFLDFTSFLLIGILSIACLNMQWNLITCIFALPFALLANIISVANIDQPLTSSSSNTQALKIKIALIELFTAPTIFSFLTLINFFPQLFIASWLGLIPSSTLANFYLSYTEYTNTEYSIKHSLYFVALINAVIMITVIASYIYIN